MIIVPNISELLLLKYILNNVAASNVKLKLFSNNVTLSETSVLADFTEVTDVSYSQKILLGANWSFATTSGVSTATYPDQTFNFTLSTIVYGIYVTNNAESALLWAEKFPAAPVTISALGNLVVTPTISLD